MNTRTISRNVKNSEYLRTRTKLGQRKIESFSHKLSHLTIRLIFLSNVSVVMEKNKIIWFIIGKLLKILFILLLLLLMILWIALGCETGRQIDEVNQKLGRSRGDERRFLMQLNQAAVVPLFTRAALPRVYLLTILNSLINEFIALACLISFILRSRQIFIITESLLTLIWFIEQYRLDDFYHHIDSIDWQSSRLNVTTHVIHLIVIAIGFICWFIDQSSHGHMRTIRDNSSIVKDTDKNITGTSGIGRQKRDGNNSAGGKGDGHHGGESSLVSGIIQSRFVDN